MKNKLLKLVIIAKFINAGMLIVVVNNYTTLLIVT